MYDKLIIYVYIPTAVILCMLLLRIMLAVDYSNRYIRSITTIDKILKNKDYVKEMPSLFYMVFALHKWTYNQFFKD